MPFITKLGAVAARAYGWIATTVSAAVNDTYFYLVALLLPGNGTNGAQNNTFLDSSTNNFTITRNGNTTQGTFSPFSQTGWSNYFDGSGDTLSAPASAAFAFGTGNFTVEAWVYATTSSTFRLATNRNPASDAAGTWSFTIASGNIISFSEVIAGEPGPSATIASIVNKWTHVVACRQSGTTRLFVDGVLVASASQTTNFSNTAYSLVIGSTPETFLTGYISNLRIIKGTALYTTFFAPPAAPLTAVSGTSLLTCQSNRIVDNSANNFTITRNGDVAVQAFSPFAPNNISPTSYSGWFDGSGDYLTAPANAAFNFGTGDFTIEAWIYTPATQTQYAAIACNFNNPDGWFLSFSTSNLVTFSNYNVVALTSSSSVPTGAWTHVAVARSGTSLKMFFNGVSVASATNSTTYGATAATSYIGFNNQTHYFSGLISNFRVVKGTAVYTSNFTPPTVPLTAIANTSLLTLQNATFIDNSTNAFTITANGNAQPITTNPFQTPSPNPISYSGYFDGTGDYLSIASNAAFNFGTGDFTIEFWLFLSSPSTTQVFLDIRNAGVGLVFYSSGGVLYVNKDNSGSVLITGGSLTGSTWLHIALSRSSGANKLFINGAQSGSTATDSTNYPTNPVYIGGNFSGGQLTTGYISNLRVVKGTALYTANFIPSNTPLTAVSGTSLLTCQNNRFVDNSTNAFAITVNGNTTPVMTNPYGYATPISSTAYSGYFDGTGDYLSVPDNTALDVEASNFTIECFIYLFGTPASKFVFAKRATGSNVGGVNIVFLSTSAPALYATINNSTWALSQTSSVSCTLGWNHLAAVRNGTNWRLYVNGVVGVDATLSGTVPNNADPFTIGAGAADGSNTITALISNFRVVKGTAVYTAAFTPPTSPLTAITNTSLLTCQNSTFIDNSTNAFAITVAGNTVTTPVNPFGYSSSVTPVSYSALTNGGSGYFDGTGDYLIFPQNAAFNLTTSDFTVDGWVYYTSTPAAGPVFSIDTTSYPSLLIQNESGVLKAYATSASLSWDILNGMSFGSISTNTWAHFALTRSGSTFRTFLNGALVTTVTSSASIENQGGTGRVGASDINVLLGYLSSFRVVRGTAIYTAAFAPPVLPLTAVSNTQLLLNYTNAGIADAASQNVLETVGNAQISTAQSKWGGGSMAFDGTGDYLYQPNQVNLQFRTGPYTIEFWIYPNSFSPLPVILDMRTVNAATGGAIQIYITTGGVVTVYGGSSTGTLLVTAGSALSTGVWAHVALTRSGTSTRLFINGTQSGSTATDSTDYGLGALWLGVIASGNNSYFNGYIDDLRITKFARYTANFTPPTAAFPTQ